MWRNGINILFFLLICGKIVLGAVAPSEMLWQNIAWGALGCCGFCSGLS